MLIDKYAMHYGLRLGLYWIVVFFVRILAAFYPAFSMLYVIMLIFTLYLCFRIGKIYLSAMNEGGKKVMLLQFMGFGIMLFFYAGLMDALVQFVYYRYINPNYISQQIEASLAILRQMKSAEHLLELYNQFGAPSARQMAMQILWNSVLSGGIIFILFSPFLLSKQKIVKTS